MLRALGVTQIVLALLGGATVHGGSAALVTIDVEGLASLRRNDSQKLRLISAWPVRGGASGRCRARS